MLADWSLLLASLEYLYLFQGSNDSNQSKSEESD